MREDEVICKSLQQDLSQDFTPELTFAEKEHLAVCDACTDLLLTRLLHQKPRVEMPADFATRVRSTLDPEPRKWRRNRMTPAYGFTTAIAVLILLTLTWSAFAYVDPNWSTLNGAIPLMLEYIVTTEIAAIALWLGIRRSAD